MFLLKKKNHKSFWVVVVVVAILRFVPYLRGSLKVEEHMAFQ